MPLIRIGIDTGGTFTDVVAVDEETGRQASTKTPSTPADPAEGFMAGVHKILALLDARGEDVAAVVHGTTVATNRLLEGRSATSASSRPRGTRTCWRSPGSRCRTATATATSG